MATTNLVNRENLTPSELDLKKWMEGEFERVFNENFRKLDMERVRKARGGDAP